MHIRIDHLVLPAARDKHPSERKAHLPGDRHRIRHQAGQHLVHLSIFQQDRRALATELERNPREAVSSDPRNVLARRRGAGEANLVDARVVNQVIADLAPGREHVEHASWEPRFKDAFGEDVRIDRCLRRRFSDDRASGGKTRCDFVDQQHQRGVPRRYAGRNPHGFANDLDQAARGPMTLLDKRVSRTQLAIKIEQAGALVARLAGEADHRADLSRPCFGQLRDPLPEQLSHLLEIGTARFRVHSRPGAVVERLPSSSDCRVDVSRRRLGVAQQGFFVVRRHHRERFCP